MSTPDAVEFAADDFCELLDLIFLAGGEHAAMLSAYVDAGTQGERILTVAAVAFGPDRAKKAHARWKKVWGDLQCHMTHLHNRKGDFLHWNDDEVKKVFEPSVNIIDQTASYCVAVSCDIDEYASMAPTEAGQERKEYLDGFRNPYPFCMHMLMMALGMMCSDKDGIHYFIEEGDTDQGQARNFIAFASKQRKRAVIPS